MKTISRIAYSNDKKNRVHLDHLGRAECCGDELGDILAPLHNVDLFAAQLFHNSSYTGTVLADARSVTAKWLLKPPFYRILQCLKKETG